MWSTENLSVTLSSRNVFSRPLPGGHFYYPRARRGVFRGMVLPGRVSGPGQGVFPIPPIGVPIFAVLNEDYCSSIYTCIML